MGEQTIFLVIIAVFVLVSAVALCIQAAYLIGMYKTVKLLEQKVVPLAPKIESLVEATRVTVELSKKHLGDIAAKANEVLDSARAQVAKVDGVVSDAAHRAKVQMDRVEMVLDDTMGRVHETVALVHTGIMKPLRQINGISAAIRATLGFLLRGSRPSVAQVTSDEEMFI